MAILSFPVEQRPAGRPLGPCLDAEQHLALHDEVWDLEQQRVGQCRPAAGHQRAADEPSAAIVDRLQHERAPSVQHERPVRLEPGHLEPEGGMEQHALADRPVLPLAVDPVGVAHPAAG